MRTDGLNSNKLFERNVFKSEDNEEQKMDEHFTSDRSTNIAFEDINDQFYSDNEIMDASELTARRQSDKPDLKYMNKRSFNNIFNADILFITDKVKLKPNKTLPETKGFGLFNVEADKNTFQKVDALRYREVVFRAAGRIKRDVPPFPDWVYRDLPEDELPKITFNIGGSHFQSLEETIVNIPNSKLALSVIEKSGEPVLFFDRDPGCFHYVLNFYRTGRLHAPLNACLSFFEEELEFWGINEEYMEPCCYSQYMAYKVACNTLKKFSESKDKSSFAQVSSTKCANFKLKLYSALIVGNRTLLSQWYSVFSATCIIFAIMIMFFGTSAFGRLDWRTQKYREMLRNESLLAYFGNTEINNQLIQVELIFSGYFMADIIIRGIICPNIFVFFTDTINWIDLLATVSSFLSALMYDGHSTGFNEAYMIILKIPRIFRLFKLTTNLKSGMDAIILTIRASSTDLFLVLLILIIFVSFFGVLIFVVELVNEIEEPSKFQTIYIGMWWAIVTMSTVGYGDYIPKTQSGFLVGCLCILCGIIICQLPVPIFLRNFSIYYNQAQSRLSHEAQVFNLSIDPESIKEAKGYDDERQSFLYSADETKMKRFSIAH